MIPEIGLMIGAYIIVRMVRLIVNHEREHWAVWTLAMVAILVTVIVLFDLLSRGSTTPNL